MEENLEIYFVKQDDDASDQSVVAAAFELLAAADHRFSPKWISSEDCSCLDPPQKKNLKIFIFNRFDGPAFERVKELGYRIYGPLCILSTLQEGVALPKEKKRPIFNLAMKGVKICCTSIDKESREKMQTLVHLMGGEMAGALTEDVTHLVAGEVGSEKYMVAIVNKKVIMTMEWVMDVWQASQSKHILATDEVFKKYKCPCFLGLTVVVSGFNGNERNKMKNFVTKGGGKYSGELKLNECTHLIVKGPKGAKYEAAKTWKVKIVEDKWLYNCMDKGIYLDTKPFEIRKDKTSTPERLSVAGPHIADVSIISCAAADNTLQGAEENDLQTSSFPNLSSFEGQTVAESVLGMTRGGNDTTLAPADIFLDGCKIYLSGVQPSIEEKLRKIITSCGGFRATEISEATTHVIIDEIIASDLEIISNLLICPHLISSNWLMDCFAQNAHIAEAKYFRSDLGLKQADKKIRAPAKFPEEMVFADKAKSASDVPAATEDNTKSTKMAQEEAQQVEDVLSQYTFVENATDDEKNNTKDADNTTMENEKEHSSDMTQDPNDFTETSGGMFHKKTFMFFGIDGDMQEMADDLEEFIDSQGGRVVHQGKRHQVADFAIVPLTGFPVTATVSDVLTNAWLALCRETESLVPLNHWLAKPIELPDDAIFEGLCVCISGYDGVEREIIVNLCQLLGAFCQDRFSKNNKDGALANTHLIVKSPTGQKYGAAKKWKIPAVGKEWLIACLTQNARVSEEEFDIDALEAKRQLEADMSLTDVENNEIILPVPTENLKKSENEGNKSDKNNPDKCSNAGEERSNRDCEVIKNKTKQIFEGVDPHTSRASVETPQDHPVQIDEHEGKASNATTGKLETLKDANVVSNRRTEPNLTPKTTLPSDAQKGNQIKGGNACPAPVTPAICTPLLRRKNKLNLQNAMRSPACTSTPLGQGEGECATPGTFLHPDFRPKFNLDGVFEPDTPQTTRDLNTSTPLGEVFSRQIAKIALNEKDEDPVEDVVGGFSQQTETPPLQGVVIAVAKKLGRSHAAYNSLVVELGGDYSWQYNDSVTHFVFQGRPNDTNKEFRTARTDGKFIVSPHWLTMCKEQSCRVDESLFPHHYNPSQALMMLSGGKETPSRNMRATRNRGPLGETPLKTANKTANGRTPSRKMPVLNIQEVVGGKKETPTKTPDENTRPLHLPSKETESRVPALHADANGEQQVSPGDPTTPSTSDGTSSSSNAGSASAGVSKRMDIVNKDLKDEIAQALGTVLEEASRSKKTRKKRGHIAQLSGSLNASGGKTPDTVTSTASTWASTKKETQTKTNPCLEPSQSLQVTWDDPTERLEKEKLAHRLERVCDPSQNTDDYLAHLDLPSTASMMKSTRTVPDRSPTPEAPSLVFPVPRSTTGILSPQPVELLSDESCDGRSAGGEVKQPPVFLFSGMQSEERVEYGALVEQLGGKVMEKQFYDPSSTHLIVAQPVRNEKFLSFVAGGKWVLHKSYLEACRRENRFVEEEPHEWGSEYTLSIMQNMTTPAFKLASAAHRWRKRISAQKKMNKNCGGAFDGWSVLLCLGLPKEDNFRRILEAGGAKVISARAPFPNDLKISHGFLDVNKTKIPRVDQAHLICLGMHCLQADYIAAYLNDDPPPDPEDFCPAEIAALRASTPNLVEAGIKRRAENEADGFGQRNKKPRL